MDTALFVGLLSVVATLLTLVFSKFYRLLEDMRGRMQTVEHEIAGNAVSNGLIGKIETIEDRRQDEHQTVKSKLDAQETRQQKIIRAIRESDHIKIRMDNSSTNQNGPERND